MKNRYKVMFRNKSTGKTIKKFVKAFTKSEAVALTMPDKNTWQTLKAVER